MIRVLFVISALSISVPVFAEKFDARLEWAERAELAMPLSGVVSKVMVKPGQRVASGDSLISLDSRRYSARVTKARSLVEQARIDKAEADRELERALELYDRTVLSDFDKNAAEINAARANAVWHTAKAALVEAQVDLDHSRLKAPFDGLVLAVQAYPGLAVISELSAQPMVVLVDDKRLAAKALVAADKINSFKPGQSLEVGVGGAWIAGEVAHLGHEPVAENERGPLYELGVVFKRPETVQPRVGSPAVIRINE
ncbi:MAG: efflux RND transporter periplasmic adaptor subunit [Candidatus Sedimenticola sp. 20ELBAFRAG]